MSGVVVVPATPVAQTFDPRQHAPATPPPLQHHSLEALGVPAHIGSRSSPKTKTRKSPAPSVASSSRSSYRHRPYPASPAGSSYSSRSRSYSEGSFFSSDEFFDSGSDDDYHCDDDDDGTSSVRDTTAPFSAESRSDSEYEPRTESISRPQAARKATAPKKKTIPNAAIDPRILVESAASKKSHARKTPPGHIKRPPNAFILFRSHCCTPQANPDGSLPPGTPTAQQLQDLGITDHRHISRIVSHLWKALAPGAKGWWEAKAHEMKLEHARMYPDYRYKPNARASETIKRRRKRVVEAQTESERRGCEDIAQALMSGQELFDPDAIVPASTASPKKTARRPRAGTGSSPARSKAKPKAKSVTTYSPSSIAPAIDIETEERQRWTLEGITEAVRMPLPPLPSPPRRKQQPCASTNSKKKKPSSLPVVHGPPQFGARRFAPSLLDPSPPPFGYENAAYSFPSTAPVFVPAPYAMMDVMSPTSTAFTPASEYELDAYFPPSHASQEMDAMLVSPTTMTFRRTSLGQWERRSFAHAFEHSQSDPYQGPLAFGNVFLQSVTEVPRERTRTNDSSLSLSRPSTAISYADSSGSTADEANYYYDEDDDCPSSYALSHSASQSSIASSSFEYSSAQYRKQPFAYHLDGESYFHAPPSLHVSHETTGLAAEPLYHTSHDRVQAPSSLDPLLSPLPPLPLPLSSPLVEAANGHDSTYEHDINYDHDTMMPMSPLANRLPNLQSRFLSRDARCSEATIRAMPSPSPRRPNEIPFAIADVDVAAAAAAAERDEQERQANTANEQQEFPVSPDPPSEPSDGDEEHDRAVRNEKRREPKPKVICLSREQAKNQALLDQISRSGYRVEIEDDA